ncbi:GAF domain-containing sensor histidine kinase [Motilibacter deserti]|uniref:Sensor-like histidine kinase SenX3 n=1 Tax=Motilibacter deserti TaxID=2714956 RepID=A0ABX0GYC6_9ACTN|nr:GAF domain-containing sensor histidine kinase [Motilibacter deserti]NHC15111.1 GAF domain-containing sensor histidine kinase [Motilibacter deserti]
MLTLIETDDAREARRLGALRAYGVLDTAPEPAFDDIASLAADLCGTAIAGISFVDTDRVWFKARVGVPLAELPRDLMLCSRTVQGTEVLEVPDVPPTGRLASHPPAAGLPQVRFYAGAPLLTSSGDAVGSLCVLDTVPRRLTDAQRKGLTTLAHQVMTQLEVRRQACEQAAAAERLREVDSLKTEFISRITHELRTPLTSINGYLEMLVSGELDADELAESLHVVQRNSARLTSLVDDVIAASQLGGAAPELERSVWGLRELARGAAAKHAALADGRGVVLRLPDGEGPEAYVFADRSRITCAISRIVHNAVLYQPSGGRVDVEVVADGDRSAVRVTDAGVGVPADEVAQVLKPFCRGRYAEEHQIPGAGLGLPLAAAAVQAHDGSLTIDGATGGGTIVTIALPAYAPACP